MIKRFPKISTGLNKDANWQIFFGENLNLMQTTVPEASFSNEFPSLQKNLHLCTEKFAPAQLRKVF
jgi:hypothetical protein